MLELTPGLKAYFLVLTGLLGLVMGSFLNCFAWRIAHGESILKGRSHCAVCDHPLGPPDLVPVFSWLFLKGRCRYCGEKISPRYPAAELFCGLMYVSLVLRFGFSWEALRGVLLCSALFTLSLVDLETMLIPDGLLVFAAAAWAVLLIPDPDRLQLLKNGLLGAACLFGAMYLLTWAFEKLAKKEAMGGGDLKLLLVLGLYLGWQQGVLMLKLACVLGLLLGAILVKLKPGTPFPFGPALSVSAWLTLLFGHAVLSWYLGLFHIPF